MSACRWQRSDELPCESRFSRLPDQMRDVRGSRLHARGRNNTKAGDDAATQLPHLANHEPNGIGRFAALEFDCHRLALAEKGGRDHVVASWGEAVRVESSIRTRSRLM